MTGDTGINHKLKKIGLPDVVFLFTIDQVASMMNVEQDTIMSVYLYFQGRSSGPRKRHHMRAVNIAPEDKKAEWRVSLEEFRLWLKRVGFQAKDITRL